MDAVILTVENRRQDATLTAIENLVIPKVGLTMKSVNPSPGPDPDQRGFTGKIDSLVKSALKTILSNTDLKRIDETRGNFTVEVDALCVNERNFYRQTHNHHKHLSVCSASWNSVCSLRVSSHSGSVQYGDLCLYWSFAWVLKLSSEIKSVFKFVCYWFAWGSGVS